MPRLGLFHRGQKAFGVCEMLLTKAKEAFKSAQKPHQHWRGAPMRSPTHKKTEKAENRGPTIPYKPYIRMEITHDDSANFAGRILLLSITIVVILVLPHHLPSLLTIVEDNISLRLKTSWDAAGYTASSLVIAAFCMKEMISLGTVAILSNLAFLAYGWALGLEPIWLLHGILLPLNCWRLKQALLQRRVERA